MEFECLEWLCVAFALRTELHGREANVLAHFLPTGVFISYLIAALVNKLICGAQVFHQSVKHTKFMEIIVHLYK